MAQRTRPPVFEWYADNYSFTERSTDWYWALGIAGLAIMLACVLFGQYLLGLVTLAGAIAIAIQGARPVREHYFFITEEGVGIDTVLYPFETMRDFSVVEFLDDTLPPALSLKTDHIFAPHIMIPITGADPEEVYDYVLRRVPEGNHEETPIERIMHLLHF